jgi:CspA family cold shock protein
VAGRCFLTTIKGVSRMRGTVKWFNATKGFGFIAPDGGEKDVFVHKSQLDKSGIFELADRQKIEFDLIEGKKGKEAANIRLL